jgi:hypothetical protein
MQIANAARPPPEEVVKYPMNRCNEVDNARKTPETKCFKKKRKDPFNV